MFGKRLTTSLVFSSLAFTIIAAAAPIGAQTGKKKPNNDSEITRQLSEAKEQLVSAAQAYKDSLLKLVPFYEAEVKKATATFEQRKSLFDQGIVSKREVEDSEKAAAAGRSKLEEVTRQLTEADTLIAEAMASDQQQELPKGGYRATAALIRFNGSAAWSLKDSGKVESFFSGKFGHTLPISAFGQTPVHDKLGFDHHDAMDVAVQPDSPEGEALMAYLRSQGISFIAFRHAVPGSATGAHIHVGRPSHRIAPSASP
jgi:hypothetical protein